MSWPIKSISLGVGGAWIALFWLGLAAALALAIWAYRAPVPPLPRTSRILLGALRFLSLGLLILTLFQPVITVAAKAGNRPLVAVLVDLSSSMALPAVSTQADTTSRFEVARSVVSGLLPHLDGEFDVELHGFGVDVTGIEPGDRSVLEDAVPGAPATALAPALSAILNGETQRPAAVVLISDGGVNSGRDPVALAERSAIPMITIPTSLDSTVHDVWVAECLANRSAHLGQETLISVTLSSNLTVATRVGVVLREEDRILTREQVTLPEGPARVPVEVRFRPDRLGAHRYSVEVEAVPGELTAGNNSRSFPIRVEEERLQLLLIADRPTWDFTFIRRALAADRTLAVTALIKKGHEGDGFQPLSGAKLGSLPTRAREIAAFGAVVLVDVDMAQLPADTRTALAGFARDGGGLLIVNPRESGRSVSAGSELERILPVRPAPAAAPPVLVTPRLTVSGSVHPVTAFGESPSRAEQIWAELPPVRMASPLEVGLAGDVLVEGLGAGNPVPLVIAGRTPSGRALIVNAALAWRWSFLLAGTTGDDLVHRRFWSEAVTWVARGQGGGNLEVHADQSVFLQGREVTLGARLTDDELKPMGDAEVAIEIESLERMPTGAGAGSPPGLPEKRRVVLGPAEALGSYSGAAGYLPPGLYRLQGDAKRGPAEWKAEGAQFLVDQASVEAATPDANPDLMRRLAARTGGAFVLPDDVVDSVRKIAREQAMAEHTIEIKLWNHAGLFIAFVCCASLEWFLRRRRGLA